MLPHGCYPERIGTWAGSWYVCPCLWACDGRGQPGLEISIFQIRALNLAQGNSIQVPHYQYGMESVSLFVVPAALPLPVGLAGGWTFAKAFLTLKDMTADGRDICVHTKSLWSWWPMNVRVLRSSKLKPEKGETSLRWWLLQDHWEEPGLLPR